jgi:hypothetical protein
MNAATSFPTRFEFRYSVDEALRQQTARSRRLAGLVGSAHSWGRVVFLAFLVSALAFFAQALGAITGSAVPLVATLLAAAFLLGAYAAWMEVGSMTKRGVFMLQGGRSFGPWHVSVSDDALEASTEGYAVRLNLASIQDVIVDDVFVVMFIDPTVEFALPRRCLGDDASVEAFKRFIEERRTAFAA